MANSDPWWYRLYNSIAQIPSKIVWRHKPKLTDADRDLLAKELASGYYVILTGSTSHLSSVLVSFLTLLKTGRWGKYTHALMNCDNITDANNRAGFKFVEATSFGVHYSTFDEVFNCDYVCLLTPKNITNEEWTAVIDNLLQTLGRPYDDLFDLLDERRMSCVEVVLFALKAANYSQDFENLDSLIKKFGNLTPQMFRQCADFTVKVEK